MDRLFFEKAWGQGSVITVTFAVNGSIKTWNGIDSNGDDIPKPTNTALQAKYKEWQNKVANEKRLAGLRDACKKAYFDFQETGNLPTDGTNTMTQQTMRHAITEVRDLQEMYDERGTVPDMAMLATVAPSLAKLLGIIQSNATV